MEAELKILRRKTAMDFVDSYFISKYGSPVNRRMSRYELEDMLDIIVEAVDVLNKKELEQAFPEVQTAIENISEYVKKEQFIKDLSTTNDPRFVRLKVAEECAELNTILLQSVLKPDTIKHEDIIKEIADVRIQFLALEALLDCEEEVKAQIPIKIQKLMDYKDTIPNFGQI